MDSKYLRQVLATIAKAPTANRCLDLGALFSLSDIAQDVPALFSLNLITKGQPAKRAYMIAEGWIFSHAPQLHRASASYPLGAKIDEAAADKNSTAIIDWLIGQLDAPADEANQSTGLAVSARYRLNGDKAGAILTAETIFERFGIPQATLSESAGRAGRGDDIQSKLGRKVIYSWKFVSELSDKRDGGKKLS